MPDDENTEKMMNSTPLVGCGSFANMFRVRTFWGQMVSTSQQMWGVPKKVADFNAYMLTMMRVE